MQLDCIFEPGGELGSNRILITLQEPGIKLEELRGEKTKIAHKKMSRLQNVNSWWPTCNGPKGKNTLGSITPWAHIRCWDGELCKDLLLHRLNQWYKIDKLL